MGDFDLTGYFVTAAMIALIIGVALGLFVGGLIFDDRLREQAIENNCAQFNPTTGNFEWIKK